MFRRVMMCVWLAAVAGCTFGDSLKPPLAPAVTAPAFRISDGAHLGAGNNPDFFLPPMVPDPSGNKNFDKGASNPHLMPTVEICEVNATTEQAVNAGASCKSGGYFLSMTLGHGQLEADDPSIDAGGTHYFFNWTVLHSTVQFFRISVRVESKALGSADVEVVANGTQLKNVNTGDFLPLALGNTLQIKFRIEQLALCNPPGVAPCASATLNLAAGGTVSAVLPGSSGPTGVEYSGAEPGQSPRRHYRTELPEPERPGARSPDVRELHAHHF